MLRNYLLIAVRHLTREKLYSVINILGLALGIGCCLLIFLLVRHEESYDNFHAHPDRLYHTVHVSYLPILKGEATIPDYSPLSATPARDVMVEEIPEIVRATNYTDQPAILQLEDKKFGSIANFVHPDFFEMFDFEWIEGSPERALSKPSEVILAQREAEKLFGKGESAVGKTFVLRIGEKSHPVVVTGVLEDHPSNTSLDYHVLVREELRPFYEENRVSWDSYNTHLYIETVEGVSQARLEEKLLSFHDTHYQDEQDRQRIADEFGEETRTSGLLPILLSEMHLRPDIVRGAVNPTYGMILSGIALLILLIACINYISLAMARSAVRLREVGVRKTLGAHSLQVMGQFWGEAILLALIAMVISIAWVELALPKFDDLVGVDMKISLFDSADMILAVIGLSLLVGLIAGVYPAVFLSRFQPAHVLKGHQSFKVRTTFTKVLVVLQYSLTLFLIVSSLVMQRQMTYVSEKDLGYNQDQVVVVPTRMGWSDEGEKLYQNIKGKLASNPDVREVSATSLNFTYGWSRFSSANENRSYYAYAFRILPNYLNMLEIEVEEGKNYEPTRLSDSTGIIVNRKLADMLEWDEPVGQTLDIFGDSDKPQRVIGVVEDYHIFSLEQPIEPVVLHMHPDVDKLNYLYFKINPLHQQETVEAIEEAWKALLPELPFQHTYLDEDLANQYRAHEDRMRLMTISTGLAILIACLGLFALASLTAANRTKEIGVRKVFGADMGSLLVLLNREILVLSLLAFVIGAPIAAWVMQDWLSQFLFKIDLEPDLFAIALLIGTGLALLTVSYQVVKVSLTKPSEALRYE